MHICHVDIKNFRALEAVSIPLKKFSILIGENGEEGQVVVGEKRFKLPDLEDVSIPDSESSDEIFRFKGETRKPSQGKKGQNIGGGNSTRYSKNSTAIGKRGEAFVLRFFEQNLKLKFPETLQNVAKKNKGWDLEYKNDLGVLQKIEIKATSGAKMDSFEITKNELDSLNYDPKNYKIFVGTGVTGIRPQIREIKDIFSKLENGAISKEPIRWKIY